MVQDFSDSLLSNANDKQTTTTRIVTMPLLADFPQDQPSTKTGKKTALISHKVTCLRHLYSKMLEYSSDYSLVAEEFKRNEIASIRNCCVSTIRCLNIFYGFNCETFATAVNILDRFLAKVKVQQKYLSCVAATCFFLAVKLHQESEEIPSATEICNLHRQSWKASDLKRMELIISQKLQWQLLQPTCPAFLKLICDIVSMISNQLFRSSSVFESMLTEFETCINYSSSAIYKPHTLAFCIAYNTLLQMNMLSPAIRHYILELQRMFHICDSEFYECYTTVESLLDQYNNNPACHPTCLSLPKPQPRMSLISRPSYYGGSDLPTIQETSQTDKQIVPLENTVTENGKENSSISVEIQKKEILRWSSVVSHRGVLCDIN